MSREADDLLERRPVGPAHRGRQEAREADALGGRVGAPRGRVRSLRGLELVAGGVERGPQVGAAAAEVARAAEARGEAAVPGRRVRVEEAAQVLLDVAVPAREVRRAAGV